MERIGALIFLAAVLVWFGLFLARSIRSDKKRRDRALEELEAEPQPPEVELRAATVLEKGAAFDWGGDLKTPRSRVSFLVRFELDFGESLTLAVDEERFAALREGDSGTLATEGGAFLDFVPGEYPNDG